MLSKKFPFEVFKQLVIGKLTSQKSHPKEKDNLDQKLRLLQRRISEIEETILDQQRSEVEKEKKINILIRDDRLIKLKDDFNEIEIRYENLLIGMPKSDSMKTSWLDGKTHDFQSLSASIDELILQADELLQQYAESGQKPPET